MISGKKIGVSIFSRQDIKLLGLKVFDYQLSLWQKQGYITKLKNGLYIFSDSLEKVLPEELSGQLYSPSYVSLERALSSYGLVPEMVFPITSVTPKTTRRFNNRMGNFIYRNIKSSLFFGYKQRKGKTRPYFMAEPEKALLDLLYLNKIRSEAALSGLRINWRVLSKLVSKTRFKMYTRAYRNRGLDEVSIMILGKL